MDFIVYVYSTARSDHWKDASTLEDMVHQAKKILPTLREERAQATRELEEEPGFVDFKYLTELKESLIEQGYVPSCFCYH